MDLDEPTDRELSVCSVRGKYPWSTKNA